MALSSRATSHTRSTSCRCIARWWRSISVCRSACSWRRSSFLSREGSSGGRVRLMAAYCRGVGSGPSRPSCGARKAEPLRQPFKLSRCDSGGCAKFDPCPRSPESPCAPPGRGWRCRRGSRWRWQPCWGWRQRRPRWPRTSMFDSCVPGSDRLRRQRAGRRPPAISVIVEAREALRKSDRDRAGRDAAKRSPGPTHPLATVGRLLGASQPPGRASQGASVDAFYARWPGTYVEDRLRNDWLLELGRRRDWADFRRRLPALRLNDDREVTCYWLITRHLDGKDVHAAATAAWFAQRDPDDGCALLGSTLARSAGLHARRHLAQDPPGRRVQPPARRRWRRPALIGKATGRAVAELWDDPARFLSAAPATWSAASATNWPCWR